MNPIKDIDDVIKYWNKIFKPNWKAIYAFFLYTDEDKQLAQYIRENFNSLDELSGESCLVFLIDEPPRTWLEDARTRTYWKNFQFEQRVQERFKQSKPYKKADSYKIAEYFGVLPESMPCILFFRDIHDNEVLTYSLSSSASSEQMSQSFREVFSIIKNAASETDLETGQYLTGEVSQIKKDVIWKTLRTYIRRKRTKGRISKILSNPIIKNIGDILKKIGTKGMG